MKTYYLSEDSDNSPFVMKDLIQELDRACAKFPERI